MEIDTRHKLLRVGQIAKPEGILGVSKSTFWSMVRAGTISQGIKIGPRMRAWRASEITALIDRLEIQGDSDV
ncbi:AlpA family phage regulatory protein [Agrobacterium vaccinii]|uniref:helix-turn-helix transcriptional regulator n=1 Tax=Agrobacterium vaccinii TaxID=2735528 RepID=UPI001E61B6BC|nr:AlpA family phage regulatory protein [Agrobacterium vaccinii]UHS63458.1 AlpA family phage regulatory protein [Agrobacterium vaccinii]